MGSWECPCHAVTYRHEWKGAGLEPGWKRPIDDGPHRRLQRTVLETCRPGSGHLCAPHALSRRLLFPGRHQRRPERHAVAGGNRKLQRPVLDADAVGRRDLQAVERLHRVRNIARRLQRLARAVSRYRRSLGAALDAGPAQEDPAPRGHSGAGPPRVRVPHRGPAISASMRDQKGRCEPSWCSSSSRMPRPDPRWRPIRRTICSVTDRPGSSTTINRMEDSRSTWT